MKELEHRYNSRRPVHTYFALLGIPFHAHLKLLAIFFLKMLPQLLLPVFIAECIRLAEQGLANSLQRLLWMTGIYLVVLVANIPLHMLFIHFASGTTRAMEMRLRGAIVRRLQQLSMRFHGDRESGRLQSKVLRDVEELVRLSEVYFQQTMGAILSVLFAFGLTLARDPWMVLSYLVVAPLAAFMVRKFRSAMRVRNDELRREMESMSQRVNEMIDLVPVTRAHGLEDVEISSVQHRLEDVRRKGARVDMLNAFFGACAFVIFMGAVAIVVALTTWAVLGEWMSLDKIALYAALFQMVVGSINQMVSLMPQVTRGMTSVRSIGEVLECPDLEENQGKPAVQDVGGRVVFDCVTFTYPGGTRPAVEDFSLAVEPGTCVAFVGPSGSGKSTLMQLAIGFLRPQQGRILLDGRPMESIDMRTYRRHIAVVPQQTILFSGSVRDNITYGLRDFTEEQIRAAVEAAHLGDVVAHLPQGLDTRVGENAVKLSGGQRQRLAIARALIRDPKLIILDEATSALDVISESEVQKAIDNLVRGRTTFIVAHRLSTIRHASLVVVLDEGRAVEMGPEPELLARNGAFARLKALQV